MKYTCAYSGCEKSFGKPSLLELHENTHENRRVFGCKACSKAYFKSSHLRAHEKRVHEGEAASCECGKALLSKESLRRHKEVCGRQYTCGMCKKMYVRLEWYLQHVRKHAGSKVIGIVERGGAMQYVDRTGEGARKARRRRDEEETSGGEEVLGEESAAETGTGHRCKVCRKKFRLKKNRNAHEMGAHGEKKYKCSSCDRKYSYRHTLNRHAVKCRGA